MIERLKKEFSITFNGAKLFEFEDKGDERKGETVYNLFLRNKC
ncbi:MAG: hypothetical protein AB1422_06325 [bacterium]